MAFYENLRDNVAGPLIIKFGRDATLRQQASTYDPTTGVNSNVDTDTAVKILTLPMSRAKDVFRSEMVESFDQFVIMSAAETALAGVEPGTDDIVVIGTEITRIIALTPVEPGGIGVIYKMGLARS